MRKYKLSGYNSGGYKANREVLFDGEIRTCRIPDPDDVTGERQLSRFRVTHPNGKVTIETHKFLQRLLDEQSYIESFLTVDLEEVTPTREEITEEKARRFGELKEKLIARFYKTRYGLVLPLLYLAGQWLEGPPERIILLSTTFFVTAVLLLAYVVIYFRKLNPRNYPFVSWLFNGLFVGAYLYMVLMYQDGIDRHFEMAEVLLLGMLGIHLSFWFGSLFDKKV